MKIETLVVGMIRENCYVVSDEQGAAAVIDPGDDAPRILKYIVENGLKVEWILLTHGHFDHVGALARVKEATGARVAIHAGDAPQIHFAPDLLCTEGDEITAGTLAFRVIETPGHTPGCVCYRCGDVLFSGDTLFFESIGRTDLPGGSFAVMRDTLVKLRDLPDADLAVYPGHMERTTLQHEREHNPFMGV